jgi:hypothetical protein
VLAAFIIRVMPLMMKAASTFETLVNFYQTTWHSNPEDSHLHTCHHESLKSHKILYAFFISPMHITKCNNHEIKSVESFKCLGRKIVTNVEVFKKKLRKE